MSDHPQKNGTAQVVGFPVGDEEKARRFHAEVTDWEQREYFGLF